MAKAYVIISGKGGVGKTTSTINLGMALNNLGEDVVILDANFTTPNIGIHLGAPIVPTTINHVLNSQTDLENAIYEHDSGTKIIPASLSLKETENIDYRKLKNIITKLKKITNLILIDAAAGLGDEAKYSLDVADEVIIITNPEMSSVTDALKTIKLSEEMRKEVKGVILTRYQGKKTEMSLSNIKNMLEVPILGIIPEDDSVKESQVIKNAVVITHPKSNAAKNYIKISRRILGEDLKVSVPVLNRGLLSRLFLRIR